MELIKFSSDTPTFALPRQGGGDEGEGKFWLHFIIEKEDCEGVNPVRKGGGLNSTLNKE
jgi:hypothetical protein